MPVPLHPGAAATSRRRVFLSPPSDACDDESKITMRLGGLGGSARPADGRHSMNERVDQAELQNPEHGLPRFRRGLVGRLLFWLAVAFSTFQIVTAFGVPLDRAIVFGVTPLDLAWAALAAGALFIGWAAARRRPALDGLFAVVALAITRRPRHQVPGGLPSQAVRTLHVGFLCLVGGGLLANHRSRTSVTRLLGWALAGAGFLIGAYQWAFYDDLVSRAGELSDADLYVGLALIALLFYFVARIMGPALVIVAGAFLAYCLLGHTCRHRSTTVATASSRSSSTWRSARRASMARRLRVVDLHLPVRALRRLPRARRHDRAVHRYRHEPVRLGARRAREGRGVLLGAHGHDLGVGRRERRGGRPVHHPADEALRL